MTDHDRRDRRERDRSRLPSDPHVDRRSGGRQIVAGAVLLLLGIVLAFLLVDVETTTFASMGYVVGVLGLVLLGNGLLLRRKSGRTTVRT